MSKKVQFRLVRYGDRWFAQKKTGRFGAWWLITHDGSESIDTPRGATLGNWNHKWFNSSGEALRAIRAHLKSRDLAEQMKGDPDEVIAVSATGEVIRWTEAA